MAEAANTTATDPPIAYEYVWFGGAPLAQIETATNTIHWYFNDHLGTPILTTNAAGTVDWRVEREPYGTQYVLLGGDRHQPLGFPGQELNEELTDEDYNIFRWYRSRWGRYSQADPLTNLGTAVTLRAFMGADAPTPDLSELNWYDYVGNDPLGSVDPLGLKPYSMCEVVSEIIKTQPFEFTKPSGKFGKENRITRRVCDLRCYCDKPNTCYRRPCLDPFCHLERYHGVNEKINIYNKSGVKPCSVLMASWMKQEMGKCSSDD